MKQCLALWIFGQIYRDNNPIWLLWASARLEMQSAILFHQFCLSVCLSVRLSVCLSNAGTVSKRMDISSYFWHSSSGTIILLSRPIAITKFQGKPLSRTVKYKGVGQFRKYRHLSRKRYKIGLYLLQNTNRKSYINRSIAVGTNDLEWPWKAGREGSKFSDRSPYARIVWPTMTEFGVVTQRHISVG